MRLYAPEEENGYYAQTQVRFEGSVLSKCVYLSVAPPLWVVSVLDRQRAGKNAP